MPLIAGVDSSTQSTKVELRDLASGELISTGSAPHPMVMPPVSEQDPQAWWTAFEAAWATALAGARAHGAVAADVAAISVGGQQHAMVALDHEGIAVHPAKLWNDTESSQDASWLIERMAAAQWAEAVGSVPVAAFTITKLSWLHRTRPDAWRLIDRVILPHDYITARLVGSIVPGTATSNRVTTDRGDASGTGYWSPTAAEYRWDLLELIDDTRDWQNVVPVVLGPMEPAGRWKETGECLVAAGSGDNMAGALGVGLRPGDAAISIGTSGTVYAVSNEPTADPTGSVAGFADATGRFLPLVCTSNAAKVVDAVRRILDVDHAEFDRLALAATPNGPTLLPYFDGERTPNRPNATGVLGGIRTDMTREQFARAAVDGVACGLLDGFDALRALTNLDGRVVLTGGGARSLAMQQVLADLIDAPVVVSDSGEAVATGAAVQAAAVFEQVGHAVIQQRWGIGTGTAVVRSDRPDPTTRDRYAALRG